MPAGSAASRSDSAACCSAPVCCCSWRPIGNGSRRGDASRCSPSRSPCCTSGGGIAAARSPALATTLHAVGTAALGGGIFLAGQVFNLAEHWPAGFLLWAIGAAAALWLLRDWPQAVWLAILAPAWLIGEWFASDLLGSVRPGALLAGVFVLALAYAAAVTPARDAAWRRAIALLGALVLVPVGVLLPFEPGLRPGTAAASGTLVAAAWAAAIVLPLLVGVWLRGRAAWPLLLAAAFVRGDRATRSRRSRRR